MASSAVGQKIVTCWSIPKVGVYRRYIENLELFTSCKANRKFMAACESLSSAIR